MWSAVTEHLEERYEMLCYDLPGHGRAPVPEGRYELEDLSRQLHDFLDSRAIATVALVGLSIGGLVGLDFALRYPARVSHLVLADTAPWYPQAARKLWQRRIDIALSHGMRAFAAEILNTWFTPESIERATVGVEYARTALADMDPCGYALGCEILLKVDLRARLGQVAPSTLVLCGEHDLPMFRTAAVSLARDIPGGVLRWLADAAHATALERPLEFAHAIDTFLADPPRSS